MRAAGLKPSKVLVWLILCALPWASLGLVASEYLGPVAMREAQALRLLTGEALIDSSSRNGNLGSGLWIRDLIRSEAGDLRSQRFVNIRAAESDGRLSDVEIVEFDEQRRIQRWLLAKSGRVSASPGLDLAEVREIRWQPQPLSQTYPTLRWEGGVDQTLIAMAAGRPERMSIAELWRFVRYLKSNQQDCRACQRHRDATDGFALCLFTATQRRAWCPYSCRGADRRGFSSDRILVGQHRTDTAVARSTDHDDSNHSFAGPKSFELVLGQSQRSHVAPAALASIKGCLALLEVCCR
jgi:lipopolysaccharide export LptBFGC system permease protein LptF